MSSPLINHSQSSHSQSFQRQSVQRQGFQQQGFQQQGFQKQGFRQRDPQQQSFQKQGFQKQGFRQRDPQQKSFQKQGFQQRRPRSQGSEAQGSEAQGSEAQGSEAQGSQQQRSYPQNGYQRSGKGSRVGITYQESRGGVANSMQAEFVQRLPYHIDIVPVLHRGQQNLILGRLKPLINLEAPHSINHKLSEEHLSNLKAQPFYVTYNMGKVDYYLYLTRENNRQTAFLINYTLNRVWSVPSKFPDQYYGETLLEVNLLKIRNGKSDQALMQTSGSNHFLILVSDVLVHCGKPQLKIQETSKGANGNVTVLANFQNRLMRLEEMFKSYQYLEESFEYRLKPYVTYDFLESFWFDLRPELDYKDLINGLLFKSCHQVTHYFYFVPSHLRRPEKVVKIDQQHRPNHLSLLVEATNTIDNYKLYCLDRDRNLKYLDIALVNDLLTSQQLQRELPEPGEKGVYLCEWNEHFQKWKPVQKTESHQPDHLVGLKEVLQ